MQLLPSPPESPSMAKGLHGGPCPFPQHGLGCNTAWDTLNSREKPCVTIKLSLGRRDRKSKMMSLTIDTV